MSKANTYHVQAIVRFDNLGVRQRLALVWVVLAGLSANFVFRNPTIYLGNQVLAPAPTGKETT